MPNTNTVDIIQYLNGLGYTQPLCNHPDRKKTEVIKIHSAENRGYLLNSMLLRHKKSHVLLPIRLNYRN